MSINRAPFNALVDDDGSNTVGSVWNKAAIQNVILDPVDAALGTWVTVPFDAANFSAQSGSWTVTAGQVQQNRYLVSGKMMWWHLEVLGSTLSAPTVYLYLTVPFGSVQAVPPVRVTQALANGAIIEVMSTINSATRLALLQLTAAPMAAGTNYILGTFMVALA